MNSVAAQLGLPGSTLCRWMRSPRKPKVKGAPATLLPVKIADETIVDRRFRVHGPGGIRLEGLSLDDVAALVSKVALSCSG